MARKKKSYRQLIAEAYEYYRSRLEYYGNVYGISLDKELQEPHYKESRKRNWKSFTTRMWSQLDKLREQSQAIEARWETENERGIRDDYGNYGDFDESEVRDSHDLLTTAFDASRRQTDTGDYEYSSFEETLYQNYMSRLYYYQFVPSVKALINTIEGDEEHFKNIIIRELSAMSDKGAGSGSGGGLPSIEGKGNYEYGEQIASYIQEFLNASTGEQLYDEGYDDGDYY